LWIWHKVELVVVEPGVLIVVTWVGDIGSDTSTALMPEASVTKATFTFHLAAEYCNGGKGEMPAERKLYHFHVSLCSKIPSAWKVEKTTKLLVQIWICFPSQMVELI